MTSLTTFSTLYRFGHPNATEKQIKKKYSFYSLFGTKESQVKRPTIHEDYLRQKDDTDSETDEEEDNADIASWLQPVGLEIFETGIETTIIPPTTSSLAHRALQILGLDDNAKYVGRTLSLIDPNKPIGEMVREALHIPGEYDVRIRLLNGTIIPEEYTCVDARIKPKERCIVEKRFRSQNILHGGMPDEGIGFRTDHLEGLYFTLFHWNQEKFIFFNFFTFVVGSLKDMKLLSYLEIPEIKSQGYRFEGIGITSNDVLWLTRYANEKHSQVVSFIDAHRPDENEWNFLTNLVHRPYRSVESFEHISYQTIVSNNGKWILISESYTQHRNKDGTFKYSFSPYEVQCTLYSVKSQLLNENKLSFQVHSTIHMDSVSSPPQWEFTNDSAYFYERNNETRDRRRNKLYKIVESNVADEDDKTVEGHVEFAFEIPSETFRLGEITIMNQSASNILFSTRHKLMIANFYYIVKFYRYEENANGLTLQPLCTVPFFDDEVTIRSLKLSNVEDTVAVDLFIKKKSSTKEIEGKSMIITIDLAPMVTNNFLSISYWTVPFLTNDDSGIIFHPTFSKLFSHQNQFYEGVNEVELVLWTPLRDYSEHPNVIHKNLPLDKTFEFANDEHYIQTQNVVLFDDEW